jgi:hypothetical protein
VPPSRFRERECPLLAHSGHVLIVLQVSAFTDQAHDGSLKVENKPPVSVNRQKFSTEFQAASHQ